MCELVYITRREAERVYNGEIPADAEVTRDMYDALRAMDTLRTNSVKVRKWTTDANGVRVLG